ncbi:MAG: hypothetical protein MUC63_02075, partial [Planctomycetes bacterium]|nr:hypothetical protein [Planctomycetota bacterium]
MRDRRREILRELRSIGASPRPAPAPEPAPAPPAAAKAPAPAARAAGECVLTSFAAFLAGLAAAEP